MGRHALLWLVALVLIALVGGAQANPSTPPILGEGAERGTTWTHSVHAQTAWLNSGGDWHDKKGVPQGADAFALSNLMVVNREQRIKFDVTQLVKRHLQAQPGRLDNLGWLLVPSAGDFSARIFGRHINLNGSTSASPERQRLPWLTVITQRGVISVQASTNVSLIQSSPAPVILDTQNNLLPLERGKAHVGLYFDLSRIPATDTIRLASLSVTVLPVQVGSGRMTIALNPVAPADLSPPTSPTRLAANDVRSARVTLGWQAATDNIRVAGYEVFRNDARVADVRQGASYSDQAVTPNTTYRYAVVAYDDAGNKSPPSDTVEARTPAAATLQFAANPTSIDRGGTSVLTWTSSNMKSCQTPWGDTRVSGQYTTPPLDASISYTITCINDMDQPSQASVAITVRDAPLPTVSLSATPTTINFGGTARLSWTSQFAERCSGNFGAIATTGTFLTSALMADTTYSVTCENADKKTASSSVTVKVNPAPAPTISLSANPTTVAPGGTSTLTWSSQNAVSCAASWGSVGLTGSWQTQALNSDTAYSITCTNIANQNAQASVIVRVQEPLPAPPLPSGIRQYLTHDGDMVGNVGTSSAPNRGVWNTVLGFPWKRGTHGDWLDADQKPFGTSITGARPYASVALLAVGPHTANVTALVQRWQANGKNKGFYLRMRGNQFPVTFAGRTHSDASIRPKLLIKMADGGTREITARANASWATTSFGVISKSETWQLSGNILSILHFDLTSVVDHVVEATLQLQSINHAAGSTTGKGIADIFEADPPEFIVPDAPTQPRLGIAAGVQDFNSLSSHPSVLFNQDMSVATGVGAYRNPATRYLNQEVGATVAQTHFITSSRTASEGKAMIVRGDANGLPEKVYDELYGRYWFKLSPNFGSNVDAIKIPAMGVQWGYWNPVGYWQSVTGNGGSPPTGLKVWNSHSRRWEYHGASIRLLVGMLAADNSAYKDLFSVSVYPYNLDQGGPFPPGELFPYIAIRRDKGYWMDMRVKQNSVSGAQDSVGNYSVANSDGALEFWLNGHKAYSRTNYRWRYHLEHGVEGVWNDWFHGGTQNPPYRMDFEMGPITVAKEYIGPPRR
jgi:hypothetical protein